MSPPLYADLGKQARDVFGKGYNYGFFKLDSTTKPHEQGKFKVNAAHNVATGAILSGVELEYKVPKYNLTLNEKWTSENVISTELSVQDQLAKQSKLTLFTTFSPVTKSRSGKIKADFGQDNVRVNADVSLTGSPVVNAAAVFGYQNFLVGVSTGYNTEKSQVTETNVAVGRDIGNFIVHAAVNNQTKYEASIYQKVNPRLQVAAMGGWEQGTQQPAFALGAIYKADKDGCGCWTLRGKVNHEGQLGLSTLHELNQHLKMTVSGSFNVKNFNEGGHKFGMGFEYEPCC